jgi:hypothetical protein
MEKVRSMAMVRPVVIAQPKMASAPGL